MSEWKEYKLVDISDYINRGVTPSYSEDGVIVINQKCVRDGQVNYEQSRFTNSEKKKITEEKYLKSFDILINSTGQGTLGRVGQVKEITTPTTVDSHLTIVRIKKNINPVFLGYVLKSKQSLIEDLAEGTTGQTELSRHKVAEIPILLPDLPTQTAIGEILSSLDEKIELNNKINQQLETLARTLFKQWFIDFEFPNENGEPYKSSGGEMVKSELGEIPKGWTAGVLSETTKLIRGISYRKPELVLKGEGIAFVNLKCFSINGTFRQNGVKYYNGKYKPEQILCSNDILVAVTDLTQDREIIGMPIIWNGSTTALPSLDTCIIRSKSSELKNFLYYEFKTKRYKSRIIEHANGSTVLHLSVKGLETYVFPLPNDRILKKWCGIIQPILETINSNINEIYELSKTRDYLLPKLICGELSINEITN
jgi:type I restriction enzyme S subunit